VRSLIRYVPDDILIDLAAPDLGHPRAYEIIMLDGSGSKSLQVTINEAA
jgi:hypothetical protein